MSLRLAANFRLTPSRADFFSIRVTLNTYTWSLIPTFKIQGGSSHLGCFPAIHGAIRISWLLIDELDFVLRIRIPVKLYKKLFPK